MRKVVLFLCLATALFAFGCKKQADTGAAAPVADVAEVVMGVQGPETGEIAVYGLQTLYGAQLAADEINAAGGINGKPLKIVHYDSRGDKVEAVNVAQRLINNDKVCGIVGEPTSGALFAMRNIVNDKKTMAISAGATAVGVADNLPYVFRNTLLDTDGAPATIKHLKDTKGWTKYAIITSTNNDYSVGLSDTYRQAILSNGGTVVIEQSINDKDTNISAQVTAMRNKDFDAVVFTGYYQEASLIMLELRKQGIKAPLVGGDGFQSPELYNVGKDAALGTVFFAGFSTSSTNPQVVEFNKKIAAKGYETDMFAAQGYDAMYLLANAAKQAGVTNCSEEAQRVKMRDALAATQNFMGVSGEMSFDAQGNGVKKPFIMEVSKDDKGGYFFKLLNQ
ncbi:MAG: ABC transporter substrate-binding protein [Deferribacteraceae bacterium]|jgi:branched-chain amino acid transport system substrate-binding protein|nr:ABC transporter substrate-binding protein [Deferribacteraceae bacterium]